MILCANPRAQYESHREAIDRAIQKVLAAGLYILGPEVTSFEQEFAAFVGVPHAVGVGSGTDALHLALRALGIGPGDEVVTVPNTAVATVAAIETAGASPVLVDIVPSTHVMCPDAFSKAITSKTRAVIPVHLYGHPADVVAIRGIARSSGIAVIEDAAQAHGARLGNERVGSMGDMACFSFYPTKNLGAIGDGGMIVTADPRLAERLCLLRQYGWSKRNLSDVPGFNSRLDELQAAVLRVKLPSLEADNARRRDLVELYRQGLEGAPVEVPGSEGVLHARHLLVVRTERRDELLEHLLRQEIGAAIHYPFPIHEQPAYRGRLAIRSPLVHAERAAREILSLPLYPELDPRDVERVIAAVRGFFGLGAGRAAPRTR